MSLELQVQQNTQAIQQIIDGIKKLHEIPSYGGNLFPQDLFLLSRNQGNQSVSISYSHLLSSLNQITGQGGIRPRFVQAQVDWEQYPEIPIWEQVEEYASTMPQIIIGTSDLLFFTVYKFTTSGLETRYYMSLDGEGTFGLGAATPAVRFISLIKPNEGTGNVIELGEIEVDGQPSPAIEDVVENSVLGPFAIINGVVNIFRTLRNDVRFDYIYTGPGIEIGIGTGVELQNEYFIDVNAQPLQDPTDIVTAESIANALGFMPTEIEWHPTFGDFPLEGFEDIMYVDKQEFKVYIWDDFEGLYIGISGSSTDEINFTEIVFLDKNYISEHEISSAVNYTFSIAETPKLGSIRKDYLVADGLNVPTFSSDFEIIYNGYLNEQNRRHRIYFEYVGGNKVLVYINYI